MKANNGLTLKGGHQTTWLPDESGAAAPHSTTLRDGGESGRDLTARSWSAPVLRRFSEE